MFERSDCLLVDIGNSRLHWRLAGQSGHVSLSVLADQERIADQFPFSPGGVRQLVCARVGPATARDQLQKMFSGCAWYDVEQFPATLLPSRYDPEHLGKDRWLAVLGARALFPDADLSTGLLVIDAGTAATFDLLTEQGHQGGWIMPGLHRWHQCLYEGTQIRRPMADPVAAVPGLNTPAAIANGWLSAVGGMEQVLRTKYPLAKLVITGGDADILTDLWPNAHHEPDLVLAGIEVWLEYQENHSCAG